MKGSVKTPLIIGAVIVGLVIVLCVCAMLFSKSFQFKLGETATIKEENIEITVLSSEKTTIEDYAGYDFETSDFLKVKVRIKNNGSDRYTWYHSKFKIGSNIVSLSVHDDDLPLEIDAGKVEEGYLYFKYTDEGVMNYYTSFKAEDENTASVEKYLFKIK